MKYLIGIDIGTTSTKIIAYTLSGKILNEENAKYQTYSPHDGHYEQDPEEIHTSVMQGLARLIKSNADNELTGVSFSVAMHSVIVLDASGIPLTRAILWSDRRSNPQVKEFKKNRENNNIFMNTGTPIHAMSPLFKIMWLKENEKEKETYNNTDKYISIKEYIFYRLFGTFYVDHSVASATGLFNIHTKEWNKESLDLLGIKETQLSKVVDVTYKVYGMKDEYLQTLGMNADVPFVVGGTDGCLANLGIGAIEGETAVITLGTSAAMRVGSKEIDVDSEERIFTYLLDKDHSILGGAVNNNGVVINWLKDNFLEDTTYEKLFSIYNEAEAGAEGLIFLPYLLGERAPIWDSDAKGVFYGVTLNHQKKHFVRAIIEGIILSIYDVFKTLEEIKDIKTIYVNGGLSKVDAYIQTMVNVFGREMLVSENYESSCFGAFIVGLAAIGEIKSIEDFKGEEYNVKRYTPDLVKHEKYKDKYILYKKVYESLKDTFAQE